MPDGPEEKIECAINLDDIAHVIAFCTSHRAAYSELCWEDIEPMLKEGWPAARGTRSTSWAAVRDMARACWIQPPDCNLE